MNITRDPVANGEDGPATPTSPVTAPAPMQAAMAVMAKMQARTAGRATKAQTGGRSLASLFIGVLIAGIIAFRVFIPVISDAISNLSGTTATIAGLLGLFASLLILIALASPLMGRV